MESFTSSKSMASATSCQNMFSLLGNLTIADGEDKTATVAETSTTSASSSTSSSDGEDEDDDPEGEILFTQFDCKSPSGKSTHKPVFTRKLLQSIAEDVAQITLLQSKPQELKAGSMLRQKRDDEQTVNLWTSIPGGNAITVNYLSQVELCPEFQHRFGNEWWRTAEFRSLNKGMSPPLLSPYYLTSYQRGADTEAFDPLTMSWWRSRLTTTQHLWENSKSYLQLTHLARLGALRLSHPITKIVCIGLGKLSSSPAWYGSAIQHMTAISLAEALDSVNQERFPTAPRVRIIAQDPSYETVDGILLQELAPANTFDFSLSDPETLLAVDRNTALITAYLPVFVPLMQILADMFVAQPHQRPAMLLVDDMPGLVHRETWCLRDRDQPGVREFLTRGYIKCERKFVGLEEELREDLFGGKAGRFWLEKMMFCLRDEGRGMA